MTHSEIIRTLFHGWPSQAEKLSKEAAGLYVASISTFSIEDAIAAVQNFVLGKVTRKSVGFLPAIDEISTEARRVRNERLDREARSKPRIAPPEPKRDGTMQDRRAAVERIMGGYQWLPRDHVPTPQEDAKKRRQALLECAMIAKDETAIAAIKAEDGQIKLSEQSLKSLGLQKEAA